MCQAVIRALTPPIATAEETETWPSLEAEAYTCDAHRLREHAYHLLVIDLPSQLLT